MLTWIHVLANCGLVTILRTWSWMNPFTALAIDGPKLCSSVPTRVRPLSVSRAAAWLVRPVTLRWLVISFVTLSVRAFWTAGSWMRGSMLAM